MSVAVNGHRERERTESGMKVRDGKARVSWRSIGCVWAVLLVGLAWAPGLRAAQPSYAQLQAKIAAAQGPKRAELLAQLVALDFDLARQAYTAGKTQEGSLRLTDLETHAADAMTLLQTEADRGKKNGMKKVEIEFRKVAFGLADLGHEVSVYSDQARIGEEQKKIAQRRDQLLTWMFQGKKRAQAKRPAPGAPS